MEPTSSRLPVSVLIGVLLFLIAQAMFFSWLVLMNSEDLCFVIRNKAWLYLCAPLASVPYSICDFSTGYYLLSGINFWMAVLGWAFAARIIAHKAEPRFFWLKACVYWIVCCVVAFAIGFVRNFLDL